MDNLFFLLERPVSELWQPFDCMAIFVFFVLCYYRKVNMMMMIMCAAGVSNDDRTSSAGERDERPGSSA